MIFYILLLCLPIFVYFSRKLQYIFNTDILKNFDENSPIPLLKNGLPFALLSSEEIFQIPREIAKKYGRSTRGRLFHMDSFCIIRARDAEKILSSSKHLSKGFVYNFLHPFLKTGLLTSDGEKWHTRRRLLTPAFHFNILKEFCEIFKEEADVLVTDLANTKGNIIDMVPMSTKFTLNTVCESAMGVKLSNIGNNGLKYRDSIYKIGKELIHRAVRPWLHLDFIYSILGYRKQLEDIIVPLREFTQSIIDNRRLYFSKKENSKEKEEASKEEYDNIYMRSKKKRAAMLDTLLQAQQKGLIDDEGIIEETDTFTFEGHDTTSAGMTFTLLLLAHHPEVQEKILEEIEAVTCGKDDLTMDDLNMMNYMERVLKESLRIYPPVPFMARNLNEDMLHDGFLFKKGTAMEIFIYDIHRDPAVFPDPEKFDPDRFLPENSNERSNFAYIPFSAGMRNCIGQRFAMLELKIMLTKIIKNFKILPVTKREELVFFADVVLRTKNPIKMKFEKRE